MSANGEIFRADVVFSSEVAEARRHGFDLQVGVGQKGVRACLIPWSSSARAACALIGAASFESRCEIPPGGDGMDALRETIRAVLDHAKQAMA